MSNNEFNINEFRREFQMFDNYLRSYLLNKDPETKKLLVALRTDFLEKYPDLEKLDLDGYYVYPYERILLFPLLKYRDIQTD